MKFYLDIPIPLSESVTKTYDLIVPAGEPSEIPLLVWIHGGAWRGGDKRIFNDFERFARRGFAVLSIDYRFIQEAPFPAQIIDCKAAIRWARAHASIYGYNADRIIVGGGSAGGHLAALLGVTNGDPKYDLGMYMDYNSNVQAVVDEYGPVNLENSDMPDFAPVMDALLGNNTLLRHDASPLQLITGTEPPFLILHGTEDPTIPFEQSQRFYKALKAAGVNAQFCAVPGGVHGFDCPEAYKILTDFIYLHTHR